MIVLTVMGLVLAGMVWLYWPRKSECCWKATDSPYRQVCKKCGAEREMFSGGCEFVEGGSRIRYWPGDHWETTYPGDPSAPCAEEL